ncbi:sterol-sensing domain of SREBP cleavage-activation-domain-containing protein [Melanogaster broomeanus]|nr:sterol-sensing domain of SREBP cleavage-activation-domain-containing protein [Melanogaster broomeanus]
MARQTTGLFSFGAITFQRIRTLADTSLRSFGIHCATHQIRLILVSAVVITSLSYPALALYSSTPSYSRLVSTSNVLDYSFLADYVAFGSDALRDLQNFWQGQDDLQIRHDDVTRARCGFDRTLRVERILIRSNTADVAGALTTQTLLLALQLEHRILELIRSQDIRCLQGSSNDCFILSPLAFWNHDEATLRSDPNISNTLKTYHGVSMGGIPITPQMVLAGRTLDRNITNVDAAKFLVLTFVFPESDCSSSAGHDTWLHTLTNLTQESVDIFCETMEPTLIALEYNHSMTKKKGFSSSISSFVYLAYGIFFAYVSWSMKRMHGVHTRIGLTFTAMFEIVASTITSLSVCALMRFKVTMVPWSLLPIVIIFVGAENMFNLVDAVTRTSVTLPVKERIAEGLSRAGLSNTMKVVSYNCVLGIIARCSAGAISQFCTFAVVVLVAHWFLAHTFFLAVLSIDIQRLEASPLYNHLQNPSLTPATAGPQRDFAPSTSDSWQHRIMYRVKVMLKGRATKNISLLLLLAITATLYTVTRPSVRGDVDIAVAFPPASLPRLSKPQFNQTQDLTRRLWKVLNPDEDPLVHLRIEVPTIAAFRPDVVAGQSSKRTLRSSTPMFDMLIWLLKILPIPMALTLLPLYGLLLYLLKDAELLEAQRNRASGDTPSTQADNSLGDRVSFSTFPRGFATDVELLAVSKNGRAFAAVSLQNELSFWRLEDKDPIIINTSPLLPHRRPSSSAQVTVSALAVDDSSKFLAFGTTSGVVNLCFLNVRNVMFYEPLILLGNVSGIKELHFAPPCPTFLKQKGRPDSRPCTPPALPEAPAIIALYGNGSVIQWNVGLRPSSYFIEPISPTPVIQNHFLSVRSADCLLVAFSHDDGSLEIMEICRTQDMPYIYCTLRAGNPCDHVAKVDACRVKLNDSNRIIVGVASAAGVISLWDAASSECLLIMDEPHGVVDQLRLSAIHLENCRFCGELPIDSFLVAVSVGHAVILYRAYVSFQARHCSCPGNIPRTNAALGSGSERRLSSSSMVCTSGPPSARRSSAASNSSAPATPSFPVSGHGILSRRVPEKESLRRPSETLSVFPMTDEYDGGHPLGPLDRSSIWTNVTVVKVGEATCERGGWDIVGGRVVGVRRISRPQGRNRTPAPPYPASTPPSRGLTEAALERWECWSYELPTSTMRASAISTLLSNDRRPPPSPSSLEAGGSANNDYPRLPFTRVTSFRVCQLIGVAGFGNTVGIFHFS